MSTKATRRAAVRHVALAAVAALTFASAAVSSAADKITVAALTFVSSSPLFIAQERGYYAEEGLEVEFKFFRAAQPVALAIASGDADFGVTAFTAGFYNLAGQGALKVIGAQSREEPGFDFSGYFASNAAYADGFDSPLKFAGRSLGITQKGSSFHLMAAMLSEATQQPLSSITLKTLETVPNMIAAVKSGQVDSIILPAHILRKLEAGGHGRIIGWVHEHTPYQLGGLFTSTKLIEERRDVVQRFVRAYQRGASDYAKGMLNRDSNGSRVFAEEAEALIPIIEKYTKAEPASIRAGAPYIDPKGRLDVGSVYAQVKLLQSLNLVDPSVDAAKIIDLSFIDGHFNTP